MDTDYRVVTVGGGGGRWKRGWGDEGINGDRQRPDFGW